MGIPGGADGLNHSTTAAVMRGGNDKLQPHRSNVRIPPSCPLIAQQRGAPHKAATKGLLRDTRSLGTVTKRNPRVDAVPERAQEMGNNLQLQAENPCSRDAESAGKPCPIATGLCHRLCALMLPRGAQPWDGSPWVQHPAIGLPRNGVSAPSPWWGWRQR